jgi:hypothetical protein
LTEIAKAAEGEKDVLEVCVSLRLVLALKGVECRAAARLLARDEAPDEMKQRRFPRPWDIEEINKATFVAVPLLSRTKEVTAICTSQVGYPLPRQIWHEFHIAALITVIRKRSIGLFHPYRWNDIGAAL